MLPTCHVHSWFNSSGKNLLCCAAAKRSQRFREIVRDLETDIIRLGQSRLQPVINGTGILIHTNFGRAPLGSDAIRAIAEIGSAYNNLEYDLTTGARGRRAGYLESGLSLLCGSEAATVVNNCAAALVLIVRHFTRRKPEVIISRGELVQIGGGFRIGEILEASGARLREVGATNKTALRDYAQAIGSETGLILKVHQSNFFISGFAGAPSTEEIATLARTKRIPFVEDLGSGAVMATEKLDLADHEPTPSETLKRGVDLVCFSGDKLLGGPQAGIIAGKARFIAPSNVSRFFVRSVATSSFSRPWPRRSKHTCAMIGDSFRFSRCSRFQSASCGNAEKN